ncbi:MAG: DUF4145 domain-containing protein [Proteobacteria bacterium]|nr:DUF4145 domain-containing protein [Pseudomonadota bacterium]
MAKQWQCPYCNRPCTIGDDDISLRLDTIGFDENRTAFGGYLGFDVYSIACPNPDCLKLTLQFSLTAWNGRHSGGGSRPKGRHQLWSLLPESTARPQPDYIPPAIRETYVEACRIKDLSPQASATLSRRCLQGMIRDFWKVEGKPNLHQEIDAIKDEVAPDVWAAIDAVRETGNIGAHMERDIDLIIEVDPGEAQALIDLIEMLLDDWYGGRDRRAERLKKVEAIGKKKIAAKAGPPDAAVSAPKA